VGFKARLIVSKEEMFFKQSMFLLELVISPPEESVYFVLLNSYNIL
jgi:hypothetical protein